MRRLPVIQEPPEPAPSRGRLLALGIGLIFTLWLPLALLALPLGPWLAQTVFGLPEDVRIAEVVLHMTPGQRFLFTAAQTAPSLTAFALAAAAGAAITESQGGSPATTALAGLSAAALAWALALMGGALSPWFVAASALGILASLGAGFGWLGAKMTAFLRKRRAGPASQRRSE